MTDAEQCVETFMIKCDTQLVDAEEQKLLHTERVSFSLHMENNVKKNKQLFHIALNFPNFLEPKNFTSDESR